MNRATCQSLAFLLLSGALVLASPASTHSMWAFFFSNLAGLCFGFSFTRREA